MKKVTRKALLTAKLYRPGKAGGGSRFVGTPDAEGKIYDPIDRDTNLGYFLQGSKNLDAEGGHRKLYHATAQNFSTFKPGGFDPKLSGEAIWMTPNKESQPAYHNIGARNAKFREGANVMPLWASIKNPLVLNNSQEAKAFCDKHGLPSDGFPLLVSPQHRAKLIELGHDGVFWQPGTDKEEVLALHPNQIKSATGNQGTYDPNEDDITKAAGGRTGYADGGRPTNAFGMYSKGAEVARALPQKKASGAQMLTMLADPKRGVKREELVNAGLLTPEGKPHPDWANRTVTSDELAQHLEASLPKVAETSYGASHGYPYKYAVDWYNAIEKAKKAKNKDEVDRLTKAWGESMIGESEPPRFQRYTLPGGESYRERLWHLDDADAGYQSSHWDADREHKRVPDVLAHVRMKDRTGPNGEKILHVEELQSDWGQEGRDQGFLTPENTEKRNAWQQKFYDLQRAKFAADDAVEKRYDELSRVINHSDPEYHAKMLSDEQWKALKEQQKQAKAAYDAHHATMPQSDLIPTGPYVGSTEGWTDLALKRVLQEAVKGDYDKLVISPGEANADLYGQRRRVNALAYHPEKKLLSFAEMNPTYDKTRPVWRGFGDPIKPEDLHKKIGKGLAQRLMQQPVNPTDGKHLLENLDDVIGGEGMQKYYNRDVPQRLQKLVKGIDPDAQVGLHDFDLPAGAQALDDADSYKGHSLDITDKIRDAVNQGLPAFKDGGEVDDDSRKDALEDFYGPTAEEHRGRWYTGTSKDKDFTAFQESRHGTWLTRDPEDASQYAMQNDSQDYKPDPSPGAKPWAMVKTNTASRVIPAFARVENPYRGDKPEWVMNTNNYKKAQSDWFDQLRSQGYDAWAPDSLKNVLVVLKNQGTNIKSAIGNSGAYDRSKKHLAKSEGGLIVDKAMALARSLTRR